jgi:Gpi18-like mannosyltransferase
LRQRPPALCVLVKLALGSPRSGQEGALKHGTTEIRWTRVAPIGFAMAAAAVWAFPFFFYEPYDYAHWTGPWYWHILGAGPVNAFVQPFGNYTPPYLYLLAVCTLIAGPFNPLIVIKLLSTFGTAWMAWTLYRLINEANGSRPAMAAALVFLLPTTIFNVPVLAQADAFWVAPGILAVTAALRRNTLSMVLWAGAAFAFKAQAIFLAPFVIAELVRNRAPLWHWAVPPIVYALAMLPAWVAGWPAADLATVYLRQAAWLPADGRPFISNAANPWALAKLVARDHAERSFWVGYTLAGIATAVYVATMSARCALTAAQTIGAAAVSATLVPFLLPGMHERFFVLAEVLTFALAFVDRRAVTPAALMQAALVLSFAGWKLQMPLLPVAGSFLVLAAMIILTSLCNSPDEYVGEMVVDTERGVDPKPIA